ncbi:uncharacterized protein LOC121253063 [Juglans microcarpa x Juglans regia]|uniref:uncharacterized protein LOC121253063 n=1 Tax=Juglans microcarpa x Juglans regia TaxID=2249226 RepID=UPI001B7F69D2|nr:uncharacterized protein LOC121253063 [Juglans microcarpa x Juglans regia]
MVYGKTISIELKSFEISREGRWLILTERGWKFVKSMKMELATARWFCRVLEDGVHARRKGFYASYREGDRGFTVQRGSNVQGAFMALEEHRGGGRCNCIFVPDDKDGRGWRKLAEGLREAASFGGHAPPTTAGASFLKPPQWYKEVLQTPRSVNISHQLDRRVASGDDSSIVLVGTQGCEEVGRRFVGFQKETIMRVLFDMQMQLGELQGNIIWLKRCVEDQGWDLIPGSSDGLVIGQVKGREPKGQQKGKATCGPEAGLSAGLAKGKGPLYGPRHSREASRPTRPVWRRHGASLPPAVVACVEGGGGLPPVAFSAKVVAPLSEGVHRGGSSDGIGSGDTTGGAISCIVSSDMEGLSHAQTRSTEAAGPSTVVALPIQPLVTVAEAVLTKAQSFIAGGDAEADCTTLSGFAVLGHAPKAIVAPFPPSWPIILPLEASGEAGSLVSSQQNLPMESQNMLMELGEPSTVVAASSPPQVAVLLFEGVSMDMKTHFQPQSWDQDSVLVVTSLDNGPSVEGDGGTSSFMHNFP